MLFNEKKFGSISTRRPRHPTFFLGFKTFFLLSYVWGSQNSTFSMIYRHDEKFNQKSSSAIVNLLGYGALHEFHLIIFLFSFTRLHGELTEWRSEKWRIRNIFFAPVYEEKESIL